MAVACVSIGWLGMTRLIQAIPKGGRGRLRRLSPPRPARRSSEQRLRPDRRRR
jgi:hypothetical protein